MPNIKEFSTPQLGLQPTEIGVEATAAAARRGGAFFNQAGGAMDALGHRASSAIQAASDTVVKWQEHREISAGAAHFAQMQDSLINAWNTKLKDPNLDPNDPSTAAEFRGGMQPGLDQFKESFITEGGRKFAEGRVDALREHMFHKTSADMSTLAGKAIITNHRQTVNSLSNTVRNDPSSMDTALSTLDATTEAKIGTSPNLTGVDAGKVRAELTQQGKEAIIKSAALGAIEKTGEVPAWTSDEKYSPYINGAELKQLAQAARYYERLGKTEERAARVQRDYEAKNDFNTKVNELEAATMPQNAGDRPQLPSDYWSKLRELSKHPGAGLEPGRLQSMVRQGEAITEALKRPEEPLGRVSHETTMGLLKRMRATDDTRLTDNTSIYDAYQDGKLNTADFNFLTREFANLRTPDGVALEKERDRFFKTFAPIIDGDFKFQNLQHSVLGTQQMYEFEMNARRQEAALRKQGKDPHLVYDPNSEHYWGRPENIDKYRVSLQEAQGYEKRLHEQDKTRAAMRAEDAKRPRGTRKQFQEGWGVWNGTKWVPETAP